MNNLTLPAGLSLLNNVSTPLSINHINEMYNITNFDKLLNKQLYSSNRCTKKNKIKSNKRITKKQKRNK